MSLPAPHSWKPISDLPPNWGELSDPRVATMVRVWQDQAGDLRLKDAYTEFLKRLRRQWAIETGVLERLYTLTEGVTRTLIEQGLDAALISHEDTDASPEYVIRLIRDQHTAIDGLLQFVSAQRPLGRSYVRELHQVLTTNQQSYDAIDTLGRPVRVELEKGAWKKQPNNVVLPDGTRFEYCPPEQVESELERLLDMHATHEREGVAPDVEAAWLHHSFTLIHPFADGNGRVARCLATLVLLKANWLPLVITRHDKTAYLDALRLADAGDLRPLVQLFGSLQLRAIREALSLSEEVVRGKAALKTMLTAARAKLDQRFSQQQVARQAAVRIADTLQQVTKARLHEVATEVMDTFGEAHYKVKASVRGAVRGASGADWYYAQIVACAKALGYFANVQAYRAWAALMIDASTRTEVLYSFHGVGSYETGTLGCAAMAYRRESTGDPKQPATVFVDLVPLSQEPFTFTYADDAHQIEASYRQWVEDTVLLGLNYWQKTI